MRLVDADEVYKVLTDYYHHKTETQHEALKEALSKVPTVDAEPVKHGHWKRTDILFCRQNAVRCSCCGHLTPTYGKVLDSFCRFCGAEMDEVLNVPLRNGKSMMELERLMDEVEDV